MEAVKLYRGLICWAERNPTYHLSQRRRWNLHNNLRSISKNNGRILGRRCRGMYHLPPSPKWLRALRVLLLLVNNLELPLKVLVIALGMLSSSHPGPAESSLHMLP